MAATLTDSGEVTYISFGIEKVESTPDGDLMCYGRATDGSVDHDQQIVDPQFSSKAIRDWLATGGNIRVQHNAQRDPAGVGLEVNTDADGATWVKSLIVEPVAKKLLAASALRAYSVGIARPTIVRDAVAKGGRITDGQVVEISLVDRPANARCGISLVKSMDDGTPEYVGKVFGADDDIAKALGADVTKAAPAEDDLVNVDLPKGASISISPADFAALRTFKQQLVTKAVTAVADAEKRDIGTAERERIASEGNAVRNADGHVSYPIENAGDLHNAAHLARTGHGDVAAARRLIARRAEELGVANPLDESDDTTKAQVTGGDEQPDVTAVIAAKAVEAAGAVKAADAPAEQAEAVPDVTKDPEPRPVKKAKKPKKMPPWLNKPKDGDDSDSKGSDDDGDSDDASKVCKSFLDHTWIGTDAAGSTDVQCSKCHTTPAAAAGVTTAPMQAAPVKELLESDGPACTKGDEAEVTVKYAADLAPDPEVAALLRFKAAGTPEDLGRLHDLTCPAFHPEMAAKYHPYADMGALIDSGAWQRKTLAAAAGPLKGAMEMQEMWQAALLLKTADMADLNDWRAELHKAFRDANPGPGSYPTPGCVMPQRYNRPVLTDGRAANGTDYGAPNSSPQVATTAPDAQSFDRPPLSAGHQSPSPSHMKGDGIYPSERGVPTQLSYAQVQREGARQALVRMHEHLSRQFPSACPIDFEGPAQPERHAVPVPTGIGKSDGTSSPVTDAAPATPASFVAAAFKADPEDAGLFADADIYKSFKKMRKKLGKKILSGKMTVDEARAHLGRQFAQKGAEPPAEAVQKSHSERVAPPLVISSYTGATAPVLPDTPVAAVFDTEVIKAAVTEATSELKELLVKQQETFTTKLAEQQRVIDAIADQPDPSTAAISGLAFQPQANKSRRPAGVTDVAESAARAQAMVRRNLTHVYETHSDPYVREAAAKSLASLGVGTPAEAPMT